MLSFYVKFVQADRQTDRQTDGRTDRQMDNSTTTCPRSFDTGAQKISDMFWLSCQNYLTKFSLPLSIDELVQPVFH